jgi:hypothetical protein
MTRAGSRRSAAGGGFEGWLAVLGVACAVVAVLAVVASRYQPVSYGSFQASAFPGIPSGKGIRAVNNLGGFHEDLYIPPQRGTFGLFADITNNGTQPSNDCLSATARWAA